MILKARARPVTRASKELARVRASTMTWDALVKLWAVRQWVPCPKPKTIEEVWSMDAAGTLPGGIGTWDEVAAALTHLLREGLIERVS